MSTELDCKSSSCLPRALATLETRDLQPESVTVPFQGERAVMLSFRWNYHITNSVIEAT